MSTAELDPISRACCLLREGAAELRNCHTLAATGHDWTGEPEAKAAYDEYVATADALERWADSIGAGGVESLRGRQCLHRISEPAGEYPALPDAAWVVVEHLPVGGGWIRHERRQSYNADQMRAYVDADRAMRAAQPAGAQQPAPSAAVASKAVLAAIRAANMQLVRTGDDAFMLVTYKQATPQADSAPLAAPADTVVLEAALRAIHQAIDLIGEPDTERLRTVRRVLRGAVVVAEDSTAPQADSQPAVDALAEAEYFIDNPSAWSNFDQRASDAIAAVCKAFRASHGQAPAQAAPAYKDSTPELHVGDSAFESWYNAYSPAHKSDKQRARDAYAAGMGDPLVMAVPAAVAGPVVNRATVIEWLDANDIEVTDRQMDGLFHSAAHTTQPTQVEAADAMADSHPSPPEGIAGGWISVMERLPEWAARDDTPCFINGKEVPPTLTSETVLVALKGCGVRTDKLITIEGKSAGWWNTYGERVVAWQKTPPHPLVAERGSDG